MPVGSRGEPDPNHRVVRDVPVLFHIGVVDRRPLLQRVQAGDDDV
ncbi:MAG: hypothetical protein OXC95_04155 [Dehalococcoidia bacterium]|nr:hypothetical protein [Dehalococcoidia bacterium]